jgi:hypothetical protein
MTGKAILEINYKMSRFLTMRLMDIDGITPLRKQHTAKYDDSIVVKM